MPENLGGIIAEWHTRFGDDGPLFRNSIPRDKVRDLHEALPEISHAIPVRLVDTTASTVGGQAIGLQMLESDANLIALLAETPRAMSRDGDCSIETVALTRRVRERLGLKIGDRARIDRRDVIVGADILASLLKSLPAAGDVEAVVCGLHDRPALDRVDRLLLLFGSDIPPNQLRSHIDLLANSDGAFHTRWVLRHIEADATEAIRRRVGWLQGVEVLLAMLAIGSALMMSFMSALRSRDDAWIRKALGEDHGDRIRSATLDGLRLAVLALPAAAVLSWGGTRLFERIANSPTRIETLLSSTVMAAFYVVGFSMLIAVVKWSAGWAFNRSQSVLSGGRVSKRNHAIATITALATAMCAAICLPSAFLWKEFVRHGQMSPGYQTDDLNSVELRLLDHDDRTQEEWWNELDNLKNETATIAGIEAVGMIDPAPWAYAGTPGVLDRDEEMLLNVGITEGTLVLLAPSSRVGGEIVDDQNSKEVVLQNVNALERRDFLPAGSTIVGELSGVRFSPLDEIGRSAIIRSLRAGIGPTVTLVFKAMNIAAVRTEVEKLLARKSELYIAGPVRSVPEILSERLAPLRTSATIAALTSLLALSLAALVLLSAVRLHMLAYRTDVAIKLCLGAKPGMLAARISGKGAAIAGVGWVLGTGGGLLVWHQIVAMIGDHRLVQPLSSGWLLLAALVAISLFYYLLAAREVMRTRLANVLKQ